MYFFTHLRNPTKFLYTKAKNLSLYKYPGCRRKYSEIGEEYFEAVRCKVVVITGGMNSPTLALAEQFADTGAQAVILGAPANEEFLQMTDKLNEKYGEEKILVQPCDASKNSDVTNLFKSAKKLFRRVDLVVNSVDVDGQVDPTINMNIKSVILGTLGGFYHMGSNTGGLGGNIINVCSILGLEPFFGSPVYSGAKNFVIGFSRSMGSNYFYRLTNVKLFTICVGVTNVNTVPRANTNIPGFENLNYDKMEHINKIPAYSGETFKNCLFTVFEEGENGSLWIVENKEYYKAEMPSKEDMRIPDFC